VPLALAMHGDLTALPVDVLQPPRGYLSRRSAAACRTTHLLATGSPSLVGGMIPTSR
jgi:hypothetical protein